MNTASLAAGAASSKPHLDQKSGPLTGVVFVGLLAAGLLFAGWSLIGDVNDAGAGTTAWLPYLLLARVDRPIGVWLLFLPGLWGILLSRPSPLEAVRLVGPRAPAT